MRIFVTGGTGFLGRSACQALRDQTLLVLCRDSARAPFLAPEQVLAGDLGDPAPWRETLAAFRPEAALHLAWEGLPDYSLRTCQRNFEAGLRLFHLLQEIGCPRVVGCGTCWEYGTSAGPVAEEAVPEAVGLFAAFKTALRLAGETLFARSGQAFLWARPFFVYGSRQRPAALLPAAYRALTASSLPSIQTPDAVNDFIHVDDVAAGFACLAVGTAPAGIYNLGSGQPTRVRDLVNLLARLMQAPAVFPESDSPGQGFWADLRRVHRTTSWQPRLSLEEGIRRTLADWRTTP